MPHSKSLKGGAETASRRRGCGSPLLENAPKEPSERLRELKSICRQAEGNENTRGAFLDAVQAWRSDRSLRAAEPRVWKEGDRTIRDTFKRMLQPNLLWDIPGLRFG